MTDNPGAREAIERARSIATKIAARPALNKLVSDGQLSFEELGNLRDDIAAALQADAVSGAVGWQFRAKGFPWGDTFCTSYEKTCLESRGFELRPVYAYSPPPNPEGAADTLRQERIAELEQLIEARATWDGPCDVEHTEELRAELERLRDEQPKRGQSARQPTIAPATPM